MFYTISWIFYKHVEQLRSQHVAVNMYINISSLIAGYLFHALYLILIFFSLEASLSSDRLIIAQLGPKLKTVELHCTYLQLAMECSKGKCSGVNDTSPCNLLIYAK